jgi:NAD-dependent deacetylase
LSEAVSYRETVLAGKLKPMAIFAANAEFELERAIDFLRKASSLAVLTGAGVSAESGVPTFRDANGLWEGHAVEDVATPHAFRRDPKLVWKFYNQRRDNLRTVEPNAGHFALARLEQRFDSDRFALVTQNVDGLHRRAGSRSIYELHGNIARTRCTGCGQITDRGLEPLGDLPQCHSCGQLLRPDIVWFTESLPGDIWELAENMVANFDVLLVVGTSAIVYPAAGLIHTAKVHNRYVIECNVQSTPASSLADVTLLGKSGEVLPQLLSMLA